MIEKPEGIEQATKVAEKVSGRVGAIHDVGEVLHRDEDGSFFILYPPEHGACVDEEYQETGYVWRESPQEMAVITGLRPSDWKVEDKVAWRQFFLATGVTVEAATKAEEAGQHIW